MLYEPSCSHGLLFFKEALSNRRQTNAWSIAGIPPYQARSIVLLTSHFYPEARDQSGNARGARYQRYFPKCYSREFSPTAHYLRVRRDLAGGSDSGQRVSLRDLKAVFFIRDFAGNKAYNEGTIFATGKLLSGRKLEVTSAGGELLAGTTTGYDVRRSGFFLFRLMT